MSDHLPYTVTVRFRSGRPTVTHNLPSWNAINEYVRGLAAVAAFPLSTVLTVKASYGEEKFSLRGGGGEAVKLIKLTDKIAGLPENENLPDKKPSAPTVRPPDDPGFTPPRRTA